MNVLEVEEILKGVQFKDWTFEVVGVTKTRAEYKSFETYTASCIPKFLRVAFDSKCTTTGEDKSWKGRKWILSEHMTKSEIVMTAFKAVMTAIEHEARESFLYRGKPIFGPHINVDLLAQAYDRSDVLDVRKDPDTNENNSKRSVLSEQLA